MIILKNIPWLNDGKPLPSLTKIGEVLNLDIVCNDENGDMYLYNKSNDTYTPMISNDGFTPLKHVQVSFGSGGGF